MADDLTLSEEYRAKLDGIVSEMERNNESKDDILFVVNDFKSKYGGKKKTFSGLPTADSKEVVEPSQPNGERVKKSVESITSKFTKGASDKELEQEANKEEMFGDSKKAKEIRSQISEPLTYDQYEDAAISTMKDIQKQKKEQSIYSTPQQAEVQDGINTMVSTQEPVINPVMKDLYDKGTLTLENARKAFKQNYIDENPEVLNKLNSDNEEEVEEANKEIYKAWTKEPEELSGRERTKADRSWLEETIDSFKEGMDEREFNLKMAKELAYADDDEAKQMLEYEYKRTMESSGDIQEPQADLMSASGISKMAGTQAIPIATTMGLSAIPGVGMPASIVYSAGDAGATSYGAAFRGTYIQARAEGMDREKAYEVAKGEAKVNFATGAVEGALGAFTGGTAKVGGKYASKFASKALKPLVERAATGVSDMGIDAAAAATGQIINNWSSRSEGLKTDLFDGVADEMLGEIIFSGAMKVPSSVTSISEFRKYVKELPPQEQQVIFDNIVDSKDNIERKILNDRTNDYLSLKGQEALDNPVVSIKKDLDRLNTINESLKEGPAKEELGKNIEALDLMLKNVEQRVTIKEGDAENIIGADELSEMIDDPEFVAKVAAGEVDVNIANNEEVANKLNDAVIKLQEEVIADETETTTQEETPKEVVVDTEETRQEEVDPEAGKKFALDAILTGQIQPRNEVKQTNAREDFGMPTKQVNAAIQNIKDVASGKKKKYSKPAEMLLAKLEEYHAKGDIPVIKGTGGSTVRNEGIPISEVIKGIEESQKATEQKQEISDSELSDEMKDWLDEDEDWEGMGALNHANVSKKIVEWTGDKMPEKDIKKAIKTLRENVESSVSKKESIANALDEMKSTEWYNDLDENKQKAFDQDFRQSLGDDLKASEKIKTPTADKVFVRKEERTILKEKIKNLATGAKLGAKQKEEALTAIKKDLVTYASESLKEFPISKAKQKEINNMIASANNNNIDKTMAKIDKIVEVNIEADRKQTIRDIKKFVGSKRAILKKVGDKWKGKVPINVQEYIKNFDTSKLDGMSRNEVKATQKLINDIISAGVGEVKGIERAVKAQKRRVEAEVFQELNDGPISEVSGKESIEVELDKGDKAVIANNQLITSKTALNEMLKDNPDADLENVKVFDKKTKQIQKLNKKNKVSEFIDKWINPTTRKANLINNLLPLIKGSKVLRQKVEGVINEVNDAYFKMNEAKVEKIRSYKENVQNIFFNEIPAGVTKIGLGIVGGKSNYATRRLSKHADVIPHKEMLHPPTNDMMVNWYSLAQTKLGLAGLNRSGIDVEAVNEYMNRPENKDLKNYSDYLLNEFYPSLKGEYEPTYEHITNTKFPDDLVYYPTYSEKTDLSEAIDTEGIMDNDFNVNYMKPVAGNLEQRVKHNNMLNLTNGAHEVAIDYINKMERAKHFIPVGETVNEIFSKNNIPGIIGKIGVHKFESMMDHLSAVITGNSPRKQTTKDNYFFKGLMGLRTFGALAFKLASIPKQITSFTHYTTSPGVTMEEWIGGFAPITKQERDVYKRINTSNYVKERFKGRSIDIEANRLMDVGKRSKILKIVGSMTKLGMMPISIGDIGGVLIGGRPLALAVYRQGRMDGLNHEEAYTKAYEKFVNESESAQQSTRESETSHLQRDNVGRLFTAFTTSQTQTTNKMVAAAKNLLSKSNLNENEIRENLYNLIYYTGANVGFAMVANGFIKELFTSNYESEDDIDSLKKGAYDTAIDNTQSILSGFGEHGIIANFIINSFRGDDWKNDLPIIQELKNLGEGSAALFHFATTNKKWEDMTPSEQKKVFATVSAESIYKQYDNFKKYFNDEKDLVDAIMGYKTKEEKKNFKPKDDKIYESIFGKPYYYDDLDPRGKANYRKNNNDASLARERIRNQIKKKKK